MVNGPYGEVFTTFIMVNVAQIAVAEPYITASGTIAAVHASSSIQPA